jgi:thymidylate kinase
MRSRISAVILCGLDGSGKSTQSKKLQEYFERNNISYSYVWLRSPNRLSLPFLAILRLLGISSSKHTISGTKIGVTDLHDHKNLQNMWKKILFLDLKFVSWYKINLLIKKGKILIVDRFVIDSLVDLAIDTCKKSIIEELAPKFLRLVPQNSKIIFLDIDPKTSYERNREEELDILQKRHMLYLEISKHCVMITIDAKKSIDEIHQQILKECKLN